MSNIYELSDYQYSNLMLACNDGSAVFAQLLPQAGDPPSLHEELDGQVTEMKDLMRLGLLKDISDQFQEQIKVSELNNKRAFMVLVVTDGAVNMFKNSDKRKIN